MCGIVGYIREIKLHDNVSETLLNSLEKLEYRGYDSAGLAVLDSGKNGNTISCVKSKGRIANLRSIVDTTGFSPSGCAGIAHTRWATHGEPNDINSHPHLSQSGKIGVVHNGIIENYIELRHMLTEHGYNFLSETDTEVISQLIDYCYMHDNDPINAVRSAANMLVGSYAIGVLFSDHPDMIVGLRKDSPLIIGVCENECMLASDITAVISKTRDIIRLDEDELVVLKANEVSVYNRYGEAVQKEITHVTWDREAAEKAGYSHFMMKEISQQPTTIRSTVAEYSDNGKVFFKLNNITDEFLSSINNIYIIACGSAYHAGVVGKVLMQKHLKIPVTTEIASEFIYGDPILDEHTLAIVISQSGETIDSLHALRKARKMGAKVLAIVNVVASTIAVESDDVIYTMAGPEIAVATTKAYSAQLIVLYMLLSHIITAKAIKDPAALAFVENCIAEIHSLPTLIESMLENKETIQQLASEYRACNDMFFIGRNMDYALALEGCLKLKEISYIHSEAYAAGELKHGTISLIEDGTLVIACCTYSSLLEKMISNITEVKSRGARVIGIACHMDEVRDKAIESVCDHMIFLPGDASFVQPSLAIVPLQLFAYYVALLRGCDIDKPRNLAKSVTVE